MNYNDWGEKPIPKIDPESEAYWEAARDGHLAIQRCNECDEHQFYPRELCRNCWSRDLSFDRIDGTGQLYSYTICHTPGQPGYSDETPYVVALVDLDIPSENPSGRPVRMTSHIVDSPSADLELDQPVTVTFRRISDDPPVDLPVFTPVEV